MTHKENTSKKKKFKRNEASYFHLNFYFFMLTSIWFSLEMPETFIFLLYSWILCWMWKLTTTSYYWLINSTCIHTLYSISFHFIWLKAVANRDVERPCFCCWNKYKMKWTHILCFFFFQILFKAIRQDKRKNFYFNSSPT